MHLNFYLKEEKYKNSWGGFDPPNVPSCQEAYW
jgi:hypothetical protein